MMMIEWKEVIARLARFDAFIATVVTCLIELESRRGHRQKI